MKLIREEKINQQVKKGFTFSFRIKDEGLYGIEVLASAKSWWQNLRKLRAFFKDDDLTVIIDNISFPKKSGKRGLFDGEVAWNGNNLKGLKKTDFFLINLSSGTHTLRFLADQKPYLEAIRIYQIKESEISYLPRDNLLPQDGDRRQWLTVVLANLPLEKIEIQARGQEDRKFSIFKRDDSDLKLIINGEIQKSKEKFHQNWYWCGWRDKGKEKTFEKDLNLEPNLHYIEFWTDRGPEIKEIRLSGIRKGVYGKIAFDSVIGGTDFVYFRREPKVDPNNVLNGLKNGEIVEILEERVIGEWIESRSYIWHKIKYQDQEGYIFSSFVEIFGQERERVIEKVKEKAKEVKIDPNLAVALAWCESKFKPYAISRPFEKKDKEGDPIGAKGVFQLTKDAVNQLKQSKGIYHFVVEDYFSIDQNIEGGVRYLKWLYDEYYKGKRQAFEKLVAAYNAGQGYIPSDLPLDYSKIPSKEKREEARRLVECVTKNRKRRNWRHITFVLLASFLVFLGGIRFLNFAFDQVKFKETDSTWLKAQVSEDLQVKMEDRLPAIKEYFISLEEKLNPEINVDLDKDDTEEKIAFHTQSTDTVEYKIDVYYVRAGEKQRLNSKPLYGFWIQVFLWQPKGYKEEVLILEFFAGKSWHTYFYQLDKTKNLVPIPFVSDGREYVSIISRMGMRIISFPRGENLVYFFYQGFPPDICEGDGEIYELYVGKLIKIFDYREAKDWCRNFAG